MRAWYREYWAQTWYRNTFLVRRPNQIGQARGSAREWNNIEGSGCNFTCLAIVVGIDPGRLASELSTLKGYFSADRKLRSRYVSGRRAGLVWDQNRPHERLESVTLEHIWHSQLKRRASICLKFLCVLKTTSCREGQSIVRSARRRGNHIICGTQEHSQLVAGTNKGHYYLWDPDDSETSIERNLRGEFLLLDLFTRSQDTPVEFWEYECSVA